MEIVTALARFAAQKGIIPVRAAEVFPKAAPNYGLILLMNLKKNMDWLRYQNAFLDL
jgi:hypothetical protein